MEKDRVARFDIRARLGRLQQQSEPGLRISCSHDPHEFGLLSGRALSRVAHACRR